MGTASSASPARNSWIRVAFTPVIMGGVLFPAAWTLNWTAAWLFIVLVILVQVGMILVLQRTSPDLLRERDKMRSNTKPWDKVIAPLIALVLPALMWLFAGLDLRKSWAAPLGTTVQCVGFILAAAAALIASWAMAANRFFSGTVRIQADRGQEVVSSGPYAIVRHPGCVGMIGFTLATPLALGSRMALVPSAVCVVLLIVRTVLEDRTLQAELAGYKAYAERVRSRLIPGVW